MGRRRSASQPGTHRRGAQACDVGNVSRDLALGEAKVQPALDAAESQSMLLLRGAHRRYVLEEPLELEDGVGWAGAGGGGVFEE